MDHHDAEHSTIAHSKKSGKQHNILPLWGNESTMNLNPLILANIQGSSYFKVHLFKLKTYHEVVDEIYYQVKHLEPWERGSRKTAGQTGMCGGVRGVGAGGIVSTAFCLLYKLYTLRLTRKQVNGLLTHTDSPYIRALGFMYIRYTQPPGDLYDWYEDYLQDEEEIDVKAGGGQTMTIGQMVYQFLTKLDWFSTLFPRIPVPIKKQIDKKLDDYSNLNKINFHVATTQRQASPPPSTRSNFYSSTSNEYRSGSRGKYSSGTSVNDRERERESRDLERKRREERRSFERREKERERDRDREPSRDHYTSREYNKEYRDEYRRREDGYSHYERSKSRDRYEYKEKDKHKRKHKSKDKERSRSRDRRSERERDYYRNDRNSSSEYYKDRDYDRRYR